MSERPSGRGPLGTFLAQDGAAVLLDEATPAGSHPRVGIRRHDLAALRALPVRAGVRTAVLGVELETATGALTLVPRPEWPALTSLRSRPARQGWWTVLRFAAPVDVAAVVAELGRQAVWGVSVPVRTSLDVRVLNPIGFLVDARDPVVDLTDLDLAGPVTPALVESLRSVQGVRVSAWDDRAQRAVPALAMAGVPVTSATSPGPNDTVLAEQVTAPVDLTDPLAREEHSLVLRRAAFDAFAGVGPMPSVSILLATRRADMLEHALAQVARQRGVERLELVLAPHAFEVEEAWVRERVGGLAVQVLPQAGDVLFGDVLQASATAAGGEVLLKMDDDDWYAPDVVADLLRARAYSGAEMVGMPAELHYLTEQDLTVKRGVPTERYAGFVAGGTMLLDRAALRAAGGFRPVRKYVDAQLIEGLLAAGGAIYRTHGLGYVLRRNPTGHTWQVDLDYLLDPKRTVATWPGFRPSRLLEADS